MGVVSVKSPEYPGSRPNGLPGDGFVESNQGLQALKENPFPFQKRTV
jgi:hypothetical protein